MKNDKGFSLLEVIITLSVLSSCVLLLSFAISQIQTSRSLIKDERQIEWHLFINQLEYELRESETVRTTKSELTLIKTDPSDQLKKTITYNRRFSIIRRQVDSQGHQPILLEVKSIEFGLLDEKLTIEVIFQNDETYQAAFRVRMNG
ncbi:competence type IV pilus minor pilin ComGF [Alkalibacterium kapii]|uniref:Competence protein ComGF n=1 Tax=Alkalibacterium kapii TaxID=426704 RepID=A0A511AT25_9LACT|nr:competence type IV pilus minor pilin ComGF [Alkalibacterium kapii]GEK91355.1 hypothetical protein AKA01nite_09770 [Alkalibacterium kapii]